MRPVLRIAAAICLVAGTSVAAPSAQDLFERKDYAGAARIWQEEAAEGSLEAKLALGILADRGLGQAPDPEAAFGYYLEAATEGLAEAQFNVGVMLDAGIGMERDPASALVWYSRAGLRGHLRAQYNAALILRSGDGAPQNSGLAAYWLRRAEALPAAREALGSLDKAREESPRAPNLIFEDMSDSHAEIVWTALPGSATYALEIVAAPVDGGDYDEPLALSVTQGSAMLQTLAASSDGLLWRVSGLSRDGTRYAAGSWRLGDPGLVAPLGRVRVLAGGGDPRVAGFARRLSDDLRHAGFWVRLELRADDLPHAATSVGYAYAEDKDLAGRVAAFLPVMGPGDTIRLGVGSTLPGEIVVRLGGGGDTDRVARAD